MKNDIKMMIGGLVFTFALIVGGAALLGGETEEVEGIPVSQVEGVGATPEVYELGDVPINGGIVTREYEVKNTTEKTLKLKKIATSCMCTQASVRIGDDQSRFFAMEHVMDKNPPVNMELPAGEKALVTVNFDPAAHGPQGVGPFERIVWLTFSDPAGVKELKLKGTVVP